MEYVEVQKYIGKSTVSLAEAMQHIDANGGGVLFLVDEQERLVGCISDGDIRRFLLSGGKIQEPVLAAANHSPKTASTEMEAMRLYHEKNYIAIPIVDSSGRVQDIYMKSDRHNRIRGKLCVPVVINAGGRGTRLNPFTKVLPKPLIPIGELPIIEHIMKEFQSYSCNQFHVIVNYKRQLIKAYFSEISTQYDVKWYDEEIPLGTGGGLSMLKGKVDSTFFFSNCDNLLTANYERMLEFHRENQNMVTMIGAYKNTKIPYGVLEMGQNGRIEGIKEKPLVSFLINTGIYIVEPEVLEDIEDNTPAEFPDIVERQRQRGLKVAIFPISENDWMDMGQLSELEKMRERLYDK